MIRTFLRNYSNQRVLNVSEKFYNRNPRNLELLNYKRKTKGWELQFPTQSYYLKCELVITQKDSYAFVKHISEKKIIEVSTTEPAISSKLYNNVDICAVENLGRILSVRCLQAGILSVFFDWNQYSKMSQKVTAFCEAMQDGGVSLTEPNLEEEPCQIGIDYDSISEEERTRITNSRLVDSLKLTNDKNENSKYLFSTKFDPDAKTESRQFAYEKVSTGMWWNKYYKMLMYPHDLPHWDENAICKKTPVSVKDYLPELGFQYKLKTEKK